MYVNFNSDSGNVGDKKTANGLTYEKQRNGKWMLVRDKALRKLLTRLHVTEKKTLRAIGTETGIPHSSLQKALNEFELMRSKKAYSATFNEFFDRNKEKLWAMYQKGKTTVDLANGVNAKLGTEFTHIMFHRAFVKAGYDVRNHAAAIEMATSIGRRFKMPRGHQIFSAPAMSSWDYHLDTNLAGVTFEQYKRIVHRFTYMVISRYPQLFPANAHRIDRKNSGLELDHQFSKSSGFWKWNGSEYVPRNRPVPLEIMCHPANLKLMKARANNQKGCRNHIELPELLKAIKAFKQEHGDIFDDYYGKYTKDHLIAAYAAYCKE